MLQLGFIILASLLTIKCLAQTEVIALKCFPKSAQKLSIYAILQTNRTLQDNRVYFSQTAIAGAGLQALVNTVGRVKPTVEITADLFSVRDYGPADELLEPGKTIIPGIYAGTVFQISNSLLTSITLGTTTYNKQAFLGLRPSVLFHPAKIKRWMIKASFTNVFHRHTSRNGKDFSYLSLGAGFKL